jgi:AAA domain
LHLVRGWLLDVDGTAEHGAVWLTDISVLRHALTQTNARLMVVDPIQSYLGAEVDAHRSNETRPVLDGLAGLAEEYGCCVLLLRHLGKAQTGRAIHRGLGSIDMTGAVRCEMLAGCSPDDPQQRAMVQIKNNLGGYGRALGYVIDETGQFLWTGESALTQSDILAPERTEDTTAKAEAAEWLRAYLADGQRPQDKVQEAARGAGFSWATMRRAKKDVGVQSRKCAFSGGWVWGITPAPKREGAHEDVEGAQEKYMSTFGEVEHLRTPKLVKGEL